MKISINPNIKNKVVVVTGGAGVLGSFFSRAVAEAGAKVVIIGRNEEKAVKFAEPLKEQGFQALGIGANVLDKESLETAHQRVLSAFGKTNILINCAGGNDPRATTQDEHFNLENYQSKSTKGFFDLDPIAFDEVYGLNFAGTLLPTQVFAKDMIDLPHSTIVNISSMSAFVPLTKIPAYSAAKAAINNFTQWLSVHFAPQGIRVNAIAPGFFSTEQNASLLWNADGTPTPRTKKIISQTPMGRFGEAHELMGTLLWLIDHEASGFVTGVVIPVDGGFSAFGGV